MGNNRVKLKDIAEKANISINSVSKALKNSPKISEATKLKVKKIAKELGYIPDVHAQSLRHGSLNVIAVIYDNLINPYYSSMIAILNEEFKKQLKENRISINVYPLVIVELDTLIAFENYFQSKNVKFRKILDNYYDYISKCKKPQKIEQIAEEVFHKYFPFYIFMSKMVVKNPFNNNIYKNVCEELQEKIDSNTTD